MFVISVKLKAKATFIPDQILKLLVVFFNSPFLEKTSLKFW